MLGAKWTHETIHNCNVPLAFALRFEVRFTSNNDNCRFSDHRGVVSWYTMSSMYKVFKTSNYFDLYVSVFGVCWVDRC